MIWKIDAETLSADAVEFASLSPEMKQMMIDHLLFGKSMEDDPRFAKANLALDAVIEGKKPCQS